MSLTLRSDMRSVLTDVTSLQALIIINGSLWVGPQDRPALTALLCMETWQVKQQQAESAVTLHPSQTEIDGDWTYPTYLGKNECSIT